MPHRGTVLTGLLFILVGCRDATSPHRLSLLAAGDVVNADVTAGTPAVYRATVKAGNQLAIYIQVPGAPLALTLIDATGRGVAGITAGHDPAIALQARWVTTPLLSTDAEYTVEIAAYGSTQESSFRLEAATLNSGPETGTSSIAVNAIVQEKIDHPADIDQYTLNATAGQELEVFLQQLSPGTSGSLIAVLEADGFSGSIAFSQGVPFDGDFEGSASNLILVPSSGRYRLTVSSRFPQPSGYIGPYRVEVRAIDHAPEHAAAALVVGDTITNESIDYVGDVDDFILADTPGAEYNVFLDASGTAPHRVQAEVVGRYDYSITAAPGGLPLLENPMGRIVIPSSGSVMIRVHDVANSRGGYRLFAARIDHGPEGAAPVIAAGAAPTTSAIEIPGDVDEYSFTLSTTTTLNLFLSRGADATGSGLRAQVTSSTTTTPVSYDASIVAYATSPSISTGHLSLAPGTYTLRASGESSRADGYRGSYQVQLRPVNRAPETAPTHIAIGDTVRGESLEYAGDIDSFVVSVAAGDTLNLRLLTPGGANPGIWFSVLDPVTNIYQGGSTYDESNSSASLQSGRLVLEPGDYTVLVQSANGGSIATEQGAYELALERVSARPEHHVAAISLGDTIRDEPIDYIGDYDDFYVHGLPGDEVFAHFTWNTSPSGYSTGEGALAFIDSTTGAALIGTPSFGYGQDTRRVSFPAAGVLRIRVQAVGSRTGSYSFVVTPVDRAPETRPAAFALGDTVSDAIDPSADVDEFVFQGAAAQAVDVFFQAPNGISCCGSLVLDLIDLSTNAVVTTLTTSNWTPNLEDINRRGVLLPTTGSYRVRIQSGPGFPAGGGYRFRVAATP